MKVRLVYEDPPAATDAGYPAFAEALRARPGQWAVLTDDAPSSLVTRINRGAVSGFTPEGHYEATGRTVASEPRRRFKIWVRYLPPTNEGGNVT